MILRTRRAPISAARPVSALPALLLTMVRFLAPCAISASISSDVKKAPRRPSHASVASACCTGFATSGVGFSARSTSSAVSAQNPLRPRTSTFGRFTRTWI